MRGLQCRKSLWLKIHNPSVLIREDNTRFETGNKVGQLACQLFPDGIKIQLSTSFEQIKKTRESIESGVKTIYEATFEFNDVLVMVDVLHIDEENTINIYEVKSSSKVKATHLKDLSIQYYVLNGLGYKIKSSKLICLNNKYIREDKLDIHELFLINDVSPQILELQEEIPVNLEKFKNLKNIDTITIGSHCTSPHKCDGYDHCWKHIPVFSIFNIGSLSMKEKMEFYSHGIITADQIRDVSRLTRSQQIQIQSELSKKPKIDTVAISAFLKSLTYPLYHLDFESLQQAIPEWEGSSPYTQIPFQYSLHIEQENGALEHREFLGDESSDPRYKLAESLIRDIPKDVSILAYNMKFEKGIIRNLASIFPQFSDHLLKISNNFKDLMIPFMKKQYYSHLMKGSYSIKYVLPALVPTMENAYRELEDVHNGMEAMNLFPKLADMKDHDKKKYRKALLKYCELDTLAMVRILEVLRKCVEI
jgi:hypothetical protein